jgi:hypothetical protein
MCRLITTDDYTQSALVCNDGYCGIVGVGVYICIHIYVNVYMHIPIVLY